MPAGARSRSPAAKKSPLAHSPHIAPAAMPSSGMAAQAGARSNLSLVLSLLLACLPVHLYSGGGATPLTLHLVWCLPRHGPHGVGGRSPARTVALLLLLPCVLAALSHYGLRKRFEVFKAKGGDGGGGRGAVVITGASSGIGLHAALHLDRLGPYIVYAGVRKPSDAQRLQKMSKTLRPILLDVTNPASVGAAVQEVTRSGLPLVALVNNAGISRNLPVELQSDESVRDVYEVNVFGLMRTTRLFLPLLRSCACGARVVNVGSVAGRLATAGGATYCGTKHAVEAVSDSLRLELEPFSMSVSLIEPAFVKTAIFSKSEGSKDPRKVLSDTQRALYKSVLSDEKKAREQLITAKADGPSVTSDAIQDAISSPYPQTRYVVARVDNLPAWVVVRIKWMSPDRLWDRLVSHPEVTLRTLPVVLVVLVSSVLFVLFKV